MEFFSYTETHGENKKKMHRESLKLRESLEKISVTRVQRTNGRSNLCVTKKISLRLTEKKRDTQRKLNKL